jgi:hypothetical protein
MRLSSIGAIALLSAAANLFLPLSALAESAKDQPKTETAVIAADNGWEKAEEGETSPMWTTCCCLTIAR